MESGPLTDVGSIFQQQTVSEIENIERKIRYINIFLFLFFILFFILFLFFIYLYIFEFLEEKLRKESKV